jgi:Mu-like prophage protein gp46
MSDLALSQSANGRFDLDFSGNDLHLTDSLKNAVLLSLGIWASVRVPDGNAVLEPQISGWWGSSLDDIELGSTIWKSFSDKVGEPVLDKIDAAVTQALKWMIDDGVAKDVVPDTSILSKNSVEIVVKIIRPDSSEEEYKWQVNWEATE